METAEDLVEKIMRTRLGKGFAIERLGNGSFYDRLDASAELVKADRNATRLALLDELERLCRGGHLHGVAREMVGDLRSKYRAEAQPVQQQQHKGRE